MFIHISYSSDIAIEWCFLLVLLYLAKKLWNFLVSRIPKRRKNIQYVMKRTCNQLVHSAYEMAPTINFDWLTTSLFVARIFTPRYIVCTSTCIVHGKIKCFFLQQQIVHGTTQYKVCILYERDV